MRTIQHGDLASLIVEQLESRILLLAMPTPLPNNDLLALSARGTLLIDNTSGDPTLLLERDKDHVSKFYIGKFQNGVKISARSVKRIEVLGGDHADQIRIDDSHGLIGVPITLFGGAGNDTLLGDRSPVTFDGGTGDDSIIGSSQADIILGGPGNDTLIGGNGNDQIFGEDGNDVIYGSAGNDYLFGSAGNDMLNGQTTIDSIFGDGDHQQA